MSRWQMALPVVALLALLVAPHAGFAQATNPASASAPVSAAGPDVAPAANPANPINPQTPGSAAPDASNPANYGSTPGNYTSTRPTAPSAISPAARAAEQQSGLDQAQAESLIQQKGYYRVEVHPDPASLWVWKADALKDGRPVQIGIDYRGNVVETSSAQARPCTGPGITLGITGGLGAGTQLQQADSCR